MERSLYTVLLEYILYGVNNCASDVWWGQCGGAGRYQEITVEDPQTTAMKLIQAKTRLNTIQVPASA